MIKLRANSEYMLILATYLISFGLILTNHGYYYDDFNHGLLPPSTIEEWASYSQGPWLLLTPLYKAIYSTEAGIVLGRAIIFLSYLFTALFLYRLLQRVKFVEPEASLWITLIFITFPINEGRVALVTFPYAMSNLAFFAAFWFMALYLDKQKLWLRLASLGLFLFSFITPSTLVFYGVPIIYLAYARKLRLFSPGKILAFMVSHLDYLVLPFLFWTLRSGYFHPQGDFAHHKIVSSQKLLLAPLSAVDGLYTSWWMPINEAMQNFIYYPYYVLPIVIMLWYLARDSNKFSDNPPVWWGILLGVLSFILGVIPYHVVGNTVTDGFGSRNELLLPLGASLILYYSLSFAFSKYSLQPRARVLILCLLLASFSAYNFSAYLEFQRQAFIQYGLVQAMKKNPQIKDNSTFVFVNNGYFYSNKPHRPRYFVGMMRQAFNDQKRYGVIMENKDTLASMRKFFDSAWHYGQDVGSGNGTFARLCGYSQWSYAPGDEIWEVRIDRGPGYLGMFGTIRLIAYRYFAPQLMLERLDQTIVLQCRKIDG